LNINTNIFERILLIVEFYELDGISGLAKELGYTAPEKLYRLKRNKKSTPSFDMLIDFANKFENLNLRWLITGNGEIVTVDQPMNMAAEGTEEYGVKDDLFKTMVSLFAESVAKNIEPRISKRIDDLEMRIHLKEEFELLKGEIDNKKPKPVRG
jgi:hypothetical protein